MQGTTAMTIGIKPLGARINDKIITILSETTDLRRLAQSIRCDEELPTDSKLTESHLDDLSEAVLLLSQAGALIGNLTQEALDELSD